MAPKIIFKEMSLEENIDIIKWTYFDDNDLLDIHNYTIKLFPKIENIDKSLPKEKIYKIIEAVVSDEYCNSKKMIQEEVSRYNNIWNNYNDKYFLELSKYLNINWPSDIEIIEASVGIIPVFPRYINTNSFSLTIGVTESKVIETAAHETLHFLWFKKWKELYPNCSRHEFDLPYITWKYSEMVVDPILNSKEIKKILNVDAKAYKSFYNIKDGDDYMMEKLIKIYQTNETIEEKIITGYDYIKSILEEE